MVKYVMFNAESRLKVPESAEWLSVIVARAAMT
jgi:hypothetical protein